MDQISKIWVKKLEEESQYAKLRRFYFIQDGKQKDWDLLKVHDSVSIIIYNKSIKKMIFVKQFRPPVYHSIIANECDVNNVDFEKYPPSLGITLELCAGIVDKNKSIKEIAKEEVLEECGYDVPLECFESVKQYRCDVGISGAQQEMFFCEVTNEHKKEKGGGVDDEIIEVVEYSISQAAELVKQGVPTNSPPSCLFGILWFLTNKCNQNYEYKND